MTIVREVHVRHEEAALPDRRLERLCGAAVDRRILTNARAVTDLDPRLFALELQILRIAAENGTDPDGHVGAEPNVFFEDRARLDRAPVADHAAIANDRVGADGHVVPELCPSRHDGRGMDTRHGTDRLTHRSRTMAAISASATSSP